MQHWDLFSYKTETFTEKAEVFPHFCTSLHTSRGIYLQVHMRAPQTTGIIFTCDICSYCLFSLSKVLIWSDVFCTSSSGEMRLTLNSFLSSNTSIHLPGDLSTCRKLVFIPFVYKVSSILQLYREKGLRAVWVSHFQDIYKSDRDALQHALFSSVISPNLTSLSTYLNPIKFSSLFCFNTASHAFLPGPSLLAD